MKIEEIIKKWNKRADSIRESIQYEDDPACWCGADAEEEIRDLIKDLEECEEKGSCDLSGL